MFESIKNQPTKTEERSLPILRPNIMQEISFSLVSKNHKTLTANLTRPQIRITLPEDLKDLEITEIQTKQGFHLAFGYN